MTHQGRPQPNTDTDLSPAQPQGGFRLREPPWQPLSWALEAGRCRWSLSSSTPAVTLRTWLPGWPAPKELLLPTRTLRIGLCQPSSQLRRHDGPKPSLVPDGWSKVDVGSAWPVAVCRNRQVSSKTGAPAAGDRWLVRSSPLGTICQGRCWPGSPTSSGADRNLRGEGT